MHLDEIRAIQATGRPGVLLITGGGSEAIGELLRHGGSSKTVLEAVVPYSFPAWADWVGRLPEKTVSQDAVCSLAAAAYVRARSLAPDAQVFGIGSTCNLVRHANERTGREHQAFIAVQDRHHLCVRSFHPKPGSREEQEHEVSEAILRLLHDFLQGPCAGEWITLPSDMVDYYHQDKNGIDTLYHLPYGHQITEYSLIIPGSFNPLHKAHLAMRSIAEELTGMKAIFELSVTNVDKPPLRYDDIMGRLAQFGRDIPIVLTHAPRFMTKTALFPKATFVIGLDTWERLLDPKYGSVEDTIECLSHAQAKFIVFGRLKDGIFRTVDQLPEGYLSLPGVVTVISEDKLRSDVSSTSLRAAGQGLPGAWVQRS